METNAICPVCGTPVASPRTRDYGDKSLIDCPRCGSYEISGTARAMLANRCADDPAARFRLSHALRQDASGGQKAVVLSTNLDQLIARPLPRKGDLPLRLLRALASAVGDSGMAEFRLPSATDLAGRIGAENVNEVETLLHYIDKQGWISCGRERNARITPDGWQVLEPPKPVTQVETPQEAVKETPVETKAEKARCNTCGRDNFCDVLGSFPPYNHEDDQGEKFTRIVTALACRGCGEMMVRMVTRCSAWVEEIIYVPETDETTTVERSEVTFMPARYTRQRPKWLERLEDEPLRQALEETYESLDHGGRILPAIGIRTCIDRLSFLLLGGDFGEFKTKVQLLRGKNHIGPHDETHLLAVADAGNAAAHRAHALTGEALITCLEILEGVVARTQIHPIAVEAIRAETPPKPLRMKPEKAVK